MRNRGLPTTTDSDSDSDSTQGPGQILVGLLIRYKGILGAALGALVGGSIVWFVLKRRYGGP